MPMMISGREHWTYDELLDLAHNRGLLSIETELLESPTDANGNTTICHARVTFAGPDGSHRIFTGIADANPRNTNKLIALHAPRMAETRSKARALRDALNIKGASFEELGGDEAAGATEAKAAPAAQSKPAGLATNKELGQLWAAMKAFYNTEELAKSEGRKYLQENYGKESTKELTSEECKAATKAFLEATQQGA